MSPHHTGEPQQGQFLAIEIERIGCGVQNLAGIRSPYELLLSRLEPSSAAPHRMCSSSSWWPPAEPSAGYSHFMCTADTASQPGCNECPLKENNHIASSAGCPSLLSSPLFTSRSCCGCLCKQLEKLEQCPTEECSCISQPEQECQTVIQQSDGVSLENYMP